MIRNDKELAEAREQVALIEHALEALRKRVKNPRNLAVYSEGYVDQISELQAEIESYRKKHVKAKPNGAVKKRTGKRAKV